ncbi:hypothetical protein VNO77_44352 [Canavalia gladiata]|uniref:Uncharacterized protein n=1 Tax=Canavalia gladiata TaxID=3824 RepID=A0AAN9JWX3_CANGL
MNTFEWSVITVTHSARRTDPCEGLLIWQNTGQETIDLTLPANQFGLRLQCHHKSTLVPLGPKNVPNDVSK